MLNVNLYDKGIIDFYLGRPCRGCACARVRVRLSEIERGCVRAGEPCFKVEVLMRRL